MHNQQEESALHDTLEEIFSGEKRLSRSLPETGVGEVGEAARGQAIREATELRQRIITAYAHMQHALEERRYVSRGGGLSTKHAAMGERLSLLLQHFSVTHGIPWHHFNTHTYVMPDKRPRTPPMQECGGEGWGGRVWAALFQPQEEEVGQLTGLVLGPDGFEDTHTNTHGHDTHAKHSNTTGESGGDGEDALGLDCLFQDIPASKFNTNCNRTPSPPPLPSPPTARPANGNKFSIKRNMARMKIWK